MLPLFLLYLYTRKTTVDGCYLDISTEIVKDNYLVSKMTFNTWLCAELTSVPSNLVKTVIWKYTWKQSMKEQKILNVKNANRCSAKIVLWKYKGFYLWWVLTEILPNSWFERTHENGSWRKIRFWMGRVLKQIWRKRWSEKTREISPPRNKGL